MGSIGRPQGSRKMRNALAIDVLHTWRNADIPARITGGLAYSLTNGAVGEHGDDTLVSTAAVAVRLVAAAKTGEVHVPYNTSQGRRVCVCGDFNCASLDCTDTNCCKG